MPTQVIMPALGMAQDTGTLIRWLKNEGDTVAKGEPLMEVETDKTTVEIEANASGTLTRVTAAAGDVIPVAQVIALILAPGEAAPTVPSDPAASPVAARIAEQQNIDLRQVTPANGSRITKSDVLAYAQAQPPTALTARGILPASPKARRLAAERGIDLTALNGSGPSGAVVTADLPLVASPVVEAASAAAKPPLNVSTAWRVMAERLSASWSSVPHFYLTREVDASRLQAWHKLAQGEPKVTITDLLVKLTAAALRQHPRVNASWNGGIVVNEDIHLGLAVATDEALLVPVIHNADRLNLRAIAARRAEVVERANSGRLKLDDLQGGTFTLSNLGMYGVDAFNAIVNPPQAAILAVGRIREQVVPVDGQPAVRPMLVLSLSCDHRVVDGARGAQFLDTLAALIEEPMRLMD